MASGDRDMRNRESLPLGEVAPRASLCENSPVIQPSSKNLPDNC